jgi:predicted esterase
MLAPKYHDPHINYGLDPVREKYLVRVPDSYAANVPYGLVVFIDADEVINDVPDGWASVLDARQLLFVSPENGGNDQDNNRRMGLAVLGALEMMKHYRIDPSRVYVAGYSGGARMAGMLGFYQPDVFRGTIQNCGADFYRQVPTVHATSWVSTSGRPYGTFQATDEEIAKAKQVRFVLVTGTNDFRRGNILDIFSGGFAKEGFKVKLFDVPGMQHTTCSGEILSTALDFIESASQH